MRKRKAPPTTAARGRGGGGGGGGGRRNGNARDDSRLLGADVRKIQPKLRMIANGSSRVNALRAERSACIATGKRAPKLAGRRVHDHPDIPIRAEDLMPNERLGKLRKLSGDILANVFIQTTELEDPKTSKLHLDGKTYGKGHLVTATIKLSELPKLAMHESVSHIELGEPISAPTPTIERGQPRQPSAQRWQFAAKELRGRKKPLIGIIDVQGFDFSHPDFLERGGTRFESIWDQGGSTDETGRKPPKDFPYGVELTKNMLNDAIRASAKLKIPAYEIERQSQMVEGSHGTHVASIAAGNRGVCRGAPIAAVLLALPRADVERRKSFYDSTRIAHAVEYLLGVAERLDRSISINISLGTNGHAHDGSSAVSRWIDSALAVPGRAVTVAAGNAGQEIAEFEGDRGFVMGRIHTSGHIPARDLYGDIDWLVVGNGIADISENELEIWYGAQDRFAVSVLPPGPPESARWIGPVEPQQFLENKLLDDWSLVSVYNELYHPANGGNYIAIFLSPFFAESGTVPIKAGVWTVRLHAREVRDGTFHGWIERDDPREVGRGPQQQLWSFPSFFSERSNVDNSSVGSLACGRWVVSVSNLDEERGRIHITSSQGPTRDKRCKPEIAAPGTRIVAAKGFAGADDRWVSMTGTSMASPFVAGVAGLMLTMNPKLTAAQIGGIMQRTSRPLAGGSFAWANDAGFGEIDPAACIREAASVSIPRGMEPSRHGGPKPPRRQPRRSRP